MTATVSEQIGIIEALGDRRPSRAFVRRQMRRIRDEFRAALAATLPYEGGLRAERDSAYMRRVAAKQAAHLAMRRAYLSRIGRRIDLAALLNQRRADGKPVWALIDPDRGVGLDNNGMRDVDGTIYVAGWRTIILGVRPCRNVQGDKVRLMPDGGIPPLPPAVRRLARDHKVRERALWVGLLYQPDEWLEARPDPALVVEWKDLPGEYYALAVWGGDRARIMEFVD